MTKILTPEKITIYGETRVSGENVDMGEIREIDLYPAQLHSKVEKILAENGPFERVKQKNPREPIYIQGTTIAISEFSKFSRARRYEQTIRAYLDVTKKTIKFRVIYPGGKKRLARVEYDNMAYDFAVGLFVPEPKHENRRVFEGDDVKDISDIIVGPLKAVANETKVIKKGKSEYLDAQIVEINGKRVLNLGYIYGDQAGVLFDKILSEYHGLGKKRTINIYMFGRVGGLADRLERHGLVSPVGIIDEVDIEDKHHCIYPVHNILADSKEKGLTLNVQSIVGETYELLEKSKEMGCVCVEIEMLHAIGAVNTARRSYGPDMSINFGFVGHIYDRPLIGETIEREIDSSKGEQGALGRIIEFIKRK